MSERLSLRDLHLEAGQAARRDVPLQLDPYRQGGFDYELEGESSAGHVDVSAMTSGYALRLRFSAEMKGPCSRCLREAHMAMVIDTREVHNPLANDVELQSEFVDADDQLDVAAWAQDALGLEFPPRVLCQDDCKGLCPNCGTNWNEATCDCTQKQIDDRWAKLREITFD